MRFALVRYAEGAALPRELSARLALLQLQQHGRRHPGAGERFAALCRSLRGEQFEAVERGLARLPAQQPRPRVLRGFK